MNRRSFLGLFGKAAAVAAVPSAVLTAATAATSPPMTATRFCPYPEAGVLLGDLTQPWHDMFLDDGRVINWENGDVTITHGAERLHIHI